jgi:carbon-monoxide dehydrogenase large subunit
MEKFGIGQAVRRVEDERFLKGEGNYIDDMEPDGLVHAVAVRSPHAQARVLSLDTDAAAAAPGVLKVLTIDDYHAAGLGPIPAMTEIDGLDKSTLNHPPRYAFADGMARYVGEPVAFVVAQTRHEALAAADLVIAN